MPTRSGGRFVYDPLASHGSADCRKFLVTLVLLYMVSINLLLLANLNICCACTVIIWVQYDAGLYVTSNEG